MRCLDTWILRFEILLLSANQRGQVHNSPLNWCSNFVSEYSIYNFQMIFFRLENISIGWNNFGHLVCQYWCWRVYRGLDQTPCLTKLRLSWIELLNLEINCHCAVKMFLKVYCQFNLFMRFPAQIVDTKKSCKLLKLCCDTK